MQRHVSMSSANKSCCHTWSADLQMPLWNRLTHCLLKEASILLTLLLRLCGLTVLQFTAARPPKGVRSLLGRTTLDRSMFYAKVLGSARLVVHSTAVEVF